MKYFLVAGERSGDLHGGNLVKELSIIDSDAVFVGFGGDYMSAVGVDIKLHYKEMAFMGFLEVLQNLRKIRGYLKLCKAEIQKQKPDAVILIDYGGFNMKIVSYCQSLDIPVHYYISPKVWAWNQKRAYKLKKSVDHMYVILPFEKQFFKKFDWNVDYVGNPVLDAIKHHKQRNEELPEIYTALLPGSRKQELQHALPVFKQVAQAHPSRNFVVAQVDNIDANLYEDIDELNNVSLFKGHSYDLLAGAKAAIVTSGTATLETAIWKIPQVVVYKTSWISYKIAKSFIKVPFISLVNLVADKEVVKELIQDDFNVDRLNIEFDKILSDDSYRNRMLEDYSTINEKLDEGNASANAAKLIFDRLTLRTLKSKI